MRTSTRVFVVAATVTALAVPGSTAVAAPDGASGARSSTVVWTPCAEDGSAECGTLSVPIDWSKADGPRVDVALARRKATDPSARIGSLIINPGGPGASGVDFAIYGAYYFSEEIRRHFDLVGFDPRGTARSHPVVCTLDLLLGQPPSMLTSQADFDRMVAYNRQLGDDCRRNTGPLFDHVDTSSVARDVDAIRAAVGDERLSFYGLSYGTLIGQRYAELFPHRVRALALDSNMDHSLGTAAFLYTEAGTAEDSFKEFVKGCGRDERCALYGRDIRALWSDLLARAARGELRSPFAPDVVLSPIDLINAAFSSLGGPDWFGLAQYLAALDAQTSLVSTGRSTNAWASSAPGASFGPELAENPFQAVFCEDWTLPLRDYEEFAAYQAVQQIVAPDIRFSPLALDAVMACLGWPARVNDPQHTLHVQGSPTLLMIDSLHDPITGYVWALDVAHQLNIEARLVTYEGWGHVVYRRSACTTGIVDAYLTDGTLPASDARCAAAPPELTSTAALPTAIMPLPAGPRSAVSGWSWTSRDTSPTR